LEKKRARKAQKEEEEKRAALNKGDGYGYEAAAPNPAGSTGAEIRKGSKKGNSALSVLISIFWSDAPEDESKKVDRPAVRTDGKTSSSQKLQPRCIVVPYGRFKKDRFYDWPPDPTVSRATPMAPLVDYFMESMDESFSDLDSMGSAGLGNYNDSVAEFMGDNDSTAPVTGYPEDSVDPPGVGQISVPALQKTSADFPGVDIQCMDFPGVNMKSIQQTTAQEEADVSDIDINSDAALPIQDENSEDAHVARPGQEEYAYQDDWSD